MCKLPEGPTQNLEYNGVLAKWAAEGYGSKPECEDCGCDLTGLAVYETPINWLCRACYEKD